ncbi:GGDEF and EAL domain-containing protein [Brumicola nitratireducens]|uniref:Diguanylate cyclase/phosphodiesterase with PAS/PAC sensor(S) n=1 Tax=Glaciecola nitratireducens (strain JCM 12485 / KCTC 12276 / FR1064) TaxID=1085623 RepID=G4QKV6_GLANF|nr:GGDEF and EAL domain-containing protein [Glaciecola nitratireducens]AEP29346.1 diguanylate cyclase/phosphodiesterase with PAS/PAC sensor(s) [Glaciecola nitratireducens FR1064]
MLEKELLDALNCVPEHIALTSLDGRVIFCNKLWEQGLHKYAKQELFVKAGDTWPNHDIPDKVFLESIQIALKQAAADVGLSASVQTEFFHQSYQHKLICTLNSFSSNNETMLVISMNILMDADASKTLPFKLTQDEGIILNSLLEGVVIQDASGVIISNNPASEKILGLSSAQMRGLDNADPSWGTITEAGNPCPPEDHPSSLAISLGKPVYDFTMGVNDSSGHVRWLKINSQPIFANGADKPSVSITSFVDITEEKRRQKSLFKLSERLKLALKAGQLGVWEFDTKTGKISWDERMFDIFDVKPAEFTGQFSDFINTLHPDDKERTIQIFADSLEKKQSMAFDFRIIDSHENIRHLSGTSEIIQGSNGEPDICVGINQDITLQKNAKQLLLDQHIKLLNFVSAMPVAVFSVVNNSITINKRGEHLTGYSKTELSRVEDFFNCLFSGKLEPNQDFYESVTRNTDLQSKSTMQIQHKDGSRRWITFEGCNLADRQAWVMIDMTEQVNAEKELKKLAFFDSLTGLPNRHSIEQKLIALVDIAKSTGTLFGILLIDLDSFKNVNDNYGHIVGDQLLTRVSRRLKKRLREDDTLGRIGGDEFMIIVRNIRDSDKLISIANSFIDAFTTPVVLNNSVRLSLNVTITIGASLYPIHGEDYVHLFRNADTSLYHAKAEGKNRAQLYQSEFTTSLKTKLELEANIELAIANQAFSLHFQPIVNCSNNQILSAECLMRWFHPELGYITPDKFISAAETTGQIVRLGRWVIRESFKEFVKWQQNGIELEYLAINLSPVQFNDGSLINDISIALAETGINPKSIVFEITEGMLVHNQSYTSNILKKMKKLGIRLAIDDFGTGYSSLAYLKYFDVDILKIDRSFIMDIPDNPQDMQITGAILSMAQDLNLKVVAEGVETEGQLAFLKAHNCNTYQGYFKSPAISGDEFVALFKNDKQVV